MIGQTISHYRIVEKLGEGGMGVVYIAEDTLLGRRVAIKTLSAGRSGKDPHFRSRFLREARAVSALSHPHIATIHDYGETDDGQPYIVMELVKGETLGDLMLKGKLTIPRALKIIEQVAEALAEAHHHGIVHRDIKPSNVAIDHRGQVKVLDFGLAKQINPGTIDATDPERQTLVNTQTRDGMVVGTPMYLSPEQALGIDVDARSDLFSLGALLYECIAGKPPFLGRTGIEICAKVIRDDPPAPSQLNANISTELDLVTLKALAKKPEARYQTADEMIRDLGSIRDHLQQQRAEHTITRLISPVRNAHPTGTLATLSDIFRRPRLSLGYVIAAGLLLAAIVLGAWWLSRTRPYRPTTETQRLYDRAVESMRQGAFFRASKILQQAIASEDRFALAHARLAEAWTELDFSDKAKDELIRANDLLPDRSVLSQVDLLRMQAVTDIVKRDFAKATQDYQALVSSVPATEKAYALVDLGRAYEKNEQPDNAIESYQQATKLDQNYPAAFLRLGVVLARRQRMADAYAAFDHAYQLFDLGTEIEGMTEVLIQRAVLLGQERKVNEAREQLQQALTKSMALENKDKHIKVLLNLSNTEINAGDVTQAEQYSAQAVALAQANGMENLTTAGLIDIGYAYLYRGNYPEAEKYFNQGLQLAQLYKGKRNEARAFLSLASLRTQEGNPDAVPGLVRQALAYYEGGGYRKETSQAYTILGRAYDETGDYDNAQRAFEQQLQAAQQVGDQSQAGYAEEGLGTVAEHREQYPLALKHFEEKYRISTSLNNRLSVGFAALSRGSVLGELGRFSDASPALAEALSIAESGGSKELQSLVHVASAKLSLNERKLPAAIAESQKAISLSQTAFKPTYVRATALLGLAESLSGQAASGRKHCDEAVTQARTLRDPLLLSNALLALAEAVLNAGDAAGALTAANEAQQRFTAAGQHESEWRALAIKALATEKGGDRQGARQLASEGAVMLAKLEKEWEGEAYRHYVERPDVVSWKKQLDRLAAA
jgi:serine/threonine protein kinase/Tfp pilus assembly protein PilF/uncharacterized protein YukE